MVIALAGVALLAGGGGTAAAHHAPDRVAATAHVPRPLLGTISNSGHWRPLGPAPVMYNGRAYTGRVTALAVSPSNSNVVWLGAADGGVWESTDSGAHWAPKFDSAPIQAVGAIAIDPSHANTIYVGTGEANNNADALWGEGVFKSTDGGSTWTRYGMSSFGTGAFARLAVDPFNSADVLAAVAQFNAFWNATMPGGPAIPDHFDGIWRSTNGGVSWSPVISDTGGEFTDAGTDVVYDPSHSGVVYAGLGMENGGSQGKAGVWKSTDHGATWTQLSGGLPSIPSPHHDASGSRTGAATSPQSASGGYGDYRAAIGISHDGTHVYVAIADSGGTGGRYGDLLNSAIYVSTNRGASFTAHSIAGYSGFATDNGEHLWGYDLYVMVDPSDANRAYVGGIDVWRTNDGGATWANTTAAESTGYVHPYQHALAFFGNSTSASSSSYYIGNDGGVWKGTSGSTATTYTNLNGGGLSITQFNGGSAGDLGSDASLYGGAQNNGEDQYPAAACATCASGAGQPWREVVSGDSGDTLVDWTNNATVYEEGANGYVRCSTDGGATWRLCASGLHGTQYANFVMPLIMVPNNPNELFAGEDHIYKTTNDAQSWAQTDTSGYPIANGLPAEAVAVARSDTNYMYTAFDSQIYRSTDAGVGWQSVPLYISGYPPVTGLAVSPTDPKTVYATFGDFSSGGGGHLFQSTDAGATWTDISQGLPDVPFDSVLVYPTDPDVVFVGTDVGAFFTTTANLGASAHWYVLGNGLPNVAVDQIFTDYWETGLYVATHGRGMWELSGDTFPSPASLSGSGAHGTNINLPLQLVDTGYGVISWSTTTLPTGVTVGPSTHGVILPQNHVNLTVTFNFPTAGSYNGNLVLNTSRGDNPTVTIPYNISVS